MKTCPFCAEEIQDEAIKCRYCNEFLEGQKRPRTRGPWFFSTTSLVIGFFLVGPLVLPLVWVSPRFSRSKKVVLSVLILAITWGLWLAMQHSLSSLQEYMDLMPQVNY